MKKILGIVMSLSIVVGSCFSALATETSDIQNIQQTEEVQSVHSPTASFVKTGYVPSSLAEAPQIVGEGAIVVDMQTGYTLYEKNIQTQLYPASITKVMTATLVLENLKMDDIVTFSHNAVYSIESGSSAIYAREGEQFTVEQCMYGLMLVSGNDVANALGEQVAGTTESFADMMTQKAKDLGCISTQFKNPHGLHDEEHYTTAYDMAIIASNAYKNFPLFQTFCSTVRYVVPPTPLCDETRYWINSNRMIREGEEYYYADCVGGKTGFTNEAGGTLVTFANINGRLMLCVIMKSNNSAGAYADAISLFDYIKQTCTEQDYQVLDDKAAEDAAKEAALLESLQTTEAKTEETTTTKKQEEEKEGNFLGATVKIIIFLVVVFGALSLYVQYQRVQAKKRRMLRRKRRRMENKVDSQYRSRSRKRR